MFLLKSLYKLHVLLRYCFLHLIFKVGSRTFCLQKCQLSHLQTIFLHVASIHISDILLLVSKTLLLLCVMINTIELHKLDHCKLEQPLKLKATEFLELRFCFNFIQNLTDNFYLKVNCMVPSNLSNRNLTIYICIIPTNHIAISNLPNIASK